MSQDVNQNQKREEARLPFIKEAISIEAYILSHYDKKKDFAEELHVRPFTISRWISSGAVVIDGALYLRNRELPTPPHSEKE